MSQRRVHRRSASAKESPRRVAVGRSLDERLRPWLLAVAMGGLVARTLTPSEAAAETGSGMPWIMLWLVVGLVWIGGAVFSRRLLWRRGWIDRAMLAVLLCVAISSLVALRSEAPRSTLNMLWEWIGYGLGFCLLRQLLRTASEGRAVLAVMVALAVGHTAFAGYQYFVSLPHDRARYLDDPEGVLLEAEVVAPPGSPERKAFEDRLLYSREPFSTFALTNSLAGYLAPWLIVGMGIVAVQGGREQQEVRASAAADGSTRGPLPLTVAVLGLTLTAVAIGLLLTKSRTAWLAAGLGALLLGGYLVRQKLLIANWKHFTGAAAAVAAMIAVSISVRGLDAGVFSGARASLDVRMEYWKATGRMIAEHPWWGVGAGNFAPWYTLYKLPIAKEEIRDPHNFFLEVASSSGLWAALALLAFLTLTFRLVAKSNPQEQPVPERSPSDSPFATETAFTWRFMLIGGLAGGLLSGINVLAGFAWPGWWALACILPAMAVALWSLWSWVERGYCPAALPGIGLVVLLLNLLASGGIGFPGVGNTLWILAAVIAAQAERFAVYPSPRWAIPLAAVAIGLLAFGCLRTGYGPVVDSDRGLAAFEDEVLAGRPHAAWATLRTAAEADPWSPVPWQALQQVSFDDWLRSGSAPALAEFQKASEERLRLSPKSNLAWSETGQAFLQAFRQSGRIPLADKAVAHLRRAVELYPTSAARRADLALALAETGDKTAAAAEATRAIELHDQTPHPEKKLSAEPLEQLQRTL